MLFDVFFQTVDCKNNGITKILVKIARKMFDHDAFQVGKYRFQTIIVRFLIRERPDFFLVERNTFLQLSA